MMQRALHPSALVPSGFKVECAVDDGDIMAHPYGVAAGVRSLREAWEAAVAGIPLAEYARTRSDLRASLERFAA